MELQSATRVTYLCSWLLLPELTASPLSLLNCTLFISDHCSNWARSSWFYSCCPECSQIICRYRDSCTPLPKQWIKVSPKTLGGDPGRALLSDAPTAPLESHVHRVPASGRLALCEPSSYQKDVMQGGIKSSTHFMTWSHLLWLFLWDPLIVLRKNFGWNELFCKGHPHVLAADWVINMYFSSSLVFLRGIEDGLSDLLFSCSSKTGA